MCKEELHDFTVTKSIGEICNRRREMINADNILAGKCEWLRVV